jgi:uncharacterized protein YdhG (YjbR/CyaY superfamily)
MQSKAQDVDAYLQEVPSARRQALAQLRAICQQLLPGYVEQMRYGMPGYSKNGVGELGFASQKNYIALYILKQKVLDAHRPLLQGLSVGKGCLRYSSPQKKNFVVVAQLVAATFHSDDRIC